MRKAFPFISVIALCLILTSCINNSGEQSTTSSAAPKPSATITLSPTPTPIPTRTPGPTVTPFPTFPRYPTKEVVLNYSVAGYISDLNVFLGDSGSLLVLYSDGQIIIEDKSSYLYWQKKLSTTEINALRSQLEARGFYSLNSNHTRDETDRLYHFDGRYERVYDGTEQCVSVYGQRARRICAYEPYKEFLVPEMKNVLDFLYNYMPEDMSLYHPDRILLHVEQGRSSAVDEKAGAIPWPKNFPSLAKTDWNLLALYVDGKKADEITTFFHNHPSAAIFIEDGEVYTVYEAVVLPHETLMNP